MFGTIVEGVLSLYWRGCYYSHSSLDPPSSSSLMYNLSEVRLSFLCQVISRKPTYKISVTRTQRSWYPVVLISSLQEILDTYEGIKNRRQRVF